MSIAVSENKNSDAIVKTAGRGTIYITAAKLYFLCSCYGVCYLLSRILTTEQCGSYGFATGIVSVLNAVIVTATQQAVSKVDPEDPTRAESVRRLALKLQVFIRGSITLIDFL